ncbi:MAG TPA: XdhC family protein [Povalibacter sp.]|nr:XdhC family protein [Povalibacter sp.]
MNHRPVSLDEFFRGQRQRGAALVLATIVETSGSTYRKAGAQMLIGADGSAAGLLSGGCLESDLAERARNVIETGQALMVEYDTRSSDDILWGIGLGCEGAMRILLTRLSADNDYEPFAFAERCRRQYVPGTIALVIASTNTAYPLGTAWRSDQVPALPESVRTTMASQPRKAAAIAAEDATFLVAPVELPTKLLVLGAGPDAMPLVEIAGLLEWHVTVLDHRPAYAVADRFPRARHVELHPPGALPQFLQRTHYDAAVVMSHHLTSDQAYLAALADSAIPYIGLLGPAPRRARLMHEIGDKAARFGDRLHGPIGLDIGGRTPETIALAIVAEIQAVLSARPGGSFNATRQSEQEQPQRTQRNT